MQKTIVGIKYKDNATGVFRGRVYHYYCVLPVTVGDIVAAPTARGDSVALIAEVDVPESRIGERILPILKTIIAFAETEE